MDASDELKVGKRVMGDGIAGNSPERFSVFTYFSAMVPAVRLTSLERAVRVGGGLDSLQLLARLGIKYHKSTHACKNSGGRPIGAGLYIHGSYGRLGTAGVNQILILGIIIVHEFSFRSHGQKCLAVRCHPGVVDSTLGFDDLGHLELGC